MGDVVWKPEICNISVGKERYGFFKKKVRYYIQIDNITNYYYSEYIFWKNFFEVCENYRINYADETILGCSVERC